MITWDISGNFGIFGLTALVQLLKPFLDSAACFHKNVSLKDF